MIYAISVYTELCLTLKQMGYFETTGLFFLKCNFSL